MIIQTKGSEIDQLPFSGLLSSLVIDTDKNWQGYNITNLGAGGHDVNAKLNSLSDFLKKDGSVDLTGDWTISSNNVTLTSGTLAANLLNGGYTATRVLIGDKDATGAIKDEYPTGGPSGYMTFNGNTFEVVGAVSGDVRADAFTIVGTLAGQIYLDNDNFWFLNSNSNKDIVFKVNDGGTLKEALTLVGASASLAGYGATASGNYSLAWGSSTASGLYSVSIGTACQSQQAGDVSFGSGATASGQYCFATGNSPTASGYGSIAMGASVQATASYSIAMGYHSKSSSGLGATAIGYNVVASGEGAVALGRAINNTTQAISATSTGSFAHGYTGAAPSGLSIITSSGYSSFAQGYAAGGFMGGAGVCDGTILSNGQGSFAQGAANGGGNAEGKIWASGAGAFAQGACYGGFGAGNDARITASGAGGFAHGYAAYGEIISIGSGSVAMGYPDGGTIQAGDVAGDYGAVAIGWGNTQALGKASIAMGQAVISSNAGDNIITFGESVTNTNDSSFGIGFGALDFLFDATDFKVLQDNHKILIGAGNDLELYHNATNSLIDSNTGELQICDSATPRIRIDGTGMAFFNTAPVAKPTALTAQLTTITYTAPGTPDYAIQDLSAGGFGFVTKDEGNTVLSVIANLQTRVDELETKLQSLGLLT